MSYDDLKYQCQSLRSLWQSRTRAPGFSTYAQINTEKEQENREENTEGQRKTLTTTEVKRTQRRWSSLSRFLWLCYRSTPLLLKLHSQLWCVFCTFSVAYIFFFVAVQCCHKCLATGWITSHSPNNRPQYIWLDRRLSLAKTPHLRVCVCVPELCAGLANIK